MQLLNATKLKADYTMGMKPDGRQLLVVVVKGTFTIPDRPDQEPTLAKEQVPLIEADTFSGEPGFSAPIYEGDYAPVKPRCDVLLHGSAYAPESRPATRVNVSLRVGSLTKSFTVVGRRQWQSSLVGVYSTEPEPFTSLPISYDVAFGGADRSFEDEKRHRFVLTNPVGIGFHVNTAKEAINGKPLPSTEQTGRAITDPRGSYQPMAFGPIGRGWEPRAKLAGTYDQNWLDNVFPFLPADFQEAYYQSAPADQQMAYPQGGEEVELINLTPQGRTVFRLPRLEVPVEFFRPSGESEAVVAPLDTVILEPNLRRFILVWRASVPLKRNMFEIPMGIVGRMPNGWYRARELGKTYYPNLNEMIADQIL
jgi:hypothetical protein